MKWGPLTGTKKYLYGLIWHGTAKNAAAECDRRLRNDKTVWGKSLSPQKHEVYFEAEGRFLTLQKRANQHD